MSGLSSPHDALFKRFLGDIEIARSFLAVHLPAHLKPLCDLSTLQIESGSFIEEDLRQHYADIVYSLKIGEQTGYVYVLVEHQSDAPPLMPFRMLCYITGIMKQHLNHKHKTLPIVVPLVFYRGQRSPYPGPVDILDCFEQPELAKRIFLKPFTLIDLSIIPDEELRSHRDIALLEIVQKHIHTRDLLHGLIQDVIALIQRDGPAKDLIQAVFRYLFHEGECAHDSALLEYIREHAPQYQEDVMTLAQQFQQQGLQQGMQQGKQEGMQQGMQQGEKNALLTFLQARFSDASESLAHYQSLIEKASSRTLTEWIQRAATAATLAEVFTLH